MSSLPQPLIREVWSASSTHNLQRVPGANLSPGRTVFPASQPKGLAWSWGRDVGLWIQRQLMTPPSQPWLQLQVVKAFSLEFSTAKLWSPWDRCHTHQQAADSSVALNPRPSVSREKLFPWTGNPWKKERKTVPGLHLFLHRTWSSPLKLILALPNTPDST